MAFIKVKSVGKFRHKSKSFQKKKGARIKITKQQKKRISKTGKPPPTRN